MYYYVYLIKATNPGINKSYVGYTNNIKLRLNKHNSSKGAKSTRGYKWLLIYSKKFTNKSSAMSYEYKLKNNKTLRKKIKDSNIVNEKN